jgi:ParB family chromosome partitioning protein
MSKSRRGLLDFDDAALTDAASAGDAVQGGEPQTVPVSRVGAVRDMAESIALLEEDSTKRAHLEEILRNGQQVVSLDADLFDPSPIRDRIDNDIDDLIPSIREHGQRTPILARPHPTEPGRYQIAFGNRRQQVCQGLGIEVRAIILDLSDEQMAVAQGQENTARQDLSYIEQARFVAKLKEKYATSVVVSAINSEETAVYKMLKIVKQIPEDLILAIGRAPKIGRPRWASLAEAVATPEVARVAIEAAKRAAAKGRATDSRFEAAYQAVVERQERRVQEIRVDGGRAIAARRTSRQGDSLVISEPAFLEHVLSHLPDLYRQYLANLASGEEPSRLAAE